MKKQLLSLSLLALTLAAQAQTKRTQTVTISEDGAATMQVFYPEQPTGRAIVDCPGGGYSHLSMQNEGTDWAAYFNRQGITYGVLTYRMPKGDRSLPMSDAQNAVKMMRDSAEVWGVNPHDVGIMGFSAGGHLASTTATHAPLASRPDFQILFYPVISMQERLTHKGSVVNFLGDSRSDNQLVKAFSNDTQVRSHATPPAILLLAADDTAVPPATNAVPYYLALAKAGVPVAMHIYPSGGHGFGYRSTFAWHDEMLQELSSWLQRLSMPKAKAVKVACVGNSITDGFGINMADVNGYPPQMQRLLGADYQVKNFGVSGRTLLNHGNQPYMKEKAWQEAKEFAPDVVVVKLGTNDSKSINWGPYSGEFVRDYQQMIDELKALPSNPRIILCTPIRCLKTEQSEKWLISDSVITNEVIPAIRKVAEKNKLTLLDLNPVVAMDSKEMQRDGVHPTAKGAAKIATAVAETVKAEVAKAEAEKIGPTGKNGKTRKKKRTGK